MVTCAPRGRQYGHRRSVFISRAGYIELQAAAMWRRAFTGVFVQTILIVAVTLLTLRWGVGVRCGHGGLASGLADGVHCNTA